jgi:hypothetical protein
MSTFVERAAQSAFHEAGYAKIDALLWARKVTDFLENHYSQCVQKYGTDDELELARRLAEDFIANMRPDERSISTH